MKLKELDQKKEQKELELHKKQDEMYEMALEGKPYREIGEIYKVSRTTVNRFVEASMERRKVAQSTESQLIKARHNNELNELLKTWLPLALSLKESSLKVAGYKTVKGKLVEITLEDWEASDTATKNVLKIMERQARLNGLELPIKDGEGKDLSSPDLYLLQMVVNMTSGKLLKADPLPIQEAEIVNEPKASVRQSVSLSDQGSAR